VSWEDVRNGANYDVYSQHVLASGAVDPAWPVDGRAVCTAAGDQGTLTACQDGAGGAIVSWQDLRSGTNDIYAERVLSTGAVDPLWPVDGRGVCLAGGSQSQPSAVSDGVGGAIVTWTDTRSGGNDIYVHRIKANGFLDSYLPVDGRALCAIAGDQVGSTIASDGGGGAIVCWFDARSGAYDIYVQHLQATGSVDPAWPINGRALCTDIANQYWPTIVSDGAGGAIV